MVCVSLGEKKNQSHTGYHFPVFSFNETNFGHRYENVTKTSPVLMSYGNYLRAYSVFGNFSAKLYFSVKL